MLTTTVKALMTFVCPSAPKKKNRNDKVTIIGAGTVGSTLAYTLLNQKITSDVVLLDKNEELIKGEDLDLKQGIMFMDCPQLTSTTDNAKIANSEVVIITVGAVMLDNENEKDAAKRNTEILKEIVQFLVKYTPDSVIIVMTQPVDVCTYVVWKLSQFPAHRVIGSGTCLQSANFKTLISDRLGLSPTVVQACVIGESGDDSIPVWSGVTVCGVRLKDINSDIGTENDPEDWDEVHKEVLKRSKAIGKFKGHESWSMAQSVSKIVSTIISDTRKCMPVSTHIRGCRHRENDSGDRKDVYLSLPCVLGSNGVYFIVRQHLTENEKNLLQKSADRLNEIQAGLDFTMPKQLATV